MSVMAVVMGGTVEEVLSPVDIVMEEAVPEDIAVPEV